MLTKDTFILQLWDESRPDICGVAEVAFFKGLSAEDCSERVFDPRPFVEKAVADINKRLDSDPLLIAMEKKDATACLNVLDSVYTAIDAESLPSSVLFGMETALLNLLHKLSHTGSKVVFDSPFTNGDMSIQINGLIWMGTFERMKERIVEKVAQGFKVIKLKIGGIDFEQEVRLIDFIRKNFPADDITLRLDANCSFSRMSYNNALEKLRILADYKIHSIEQPFSVNDIELTRELISRHIIPVALDEQLIGITPANVKEKLLADISPDYIILKPSLCGGFGESLNWIETAERLGIGWWITSALESAIGLNAIAQFTGALFSTRRIAEDTSAQGLGTGELYTDDFKPCLKRHGQFISFCPS